MFSFLCYLYLDEIQAKNSAITIIQAYSMSLRQWSKTDDTIRAIGIERKDTKEIKEEKFKEIYRQTHKYEYSTSKPG